MCVYHGGGGWAGGGGGGKEKKVGEGQFKGKMTKDSFFL